MKNPENPGLYWLYFLKEKEWTVGDFNGNEWCLLGNDETYLTLGEDVQLGSEIKKPN